MVSCREREMLSPLNNASVTWIAIFLVAVTGCNIFTRLSAVPLLAKDNGDIFIVEDSKVVNGGGQPNREGTSCLFSTDGSSEQSNSQEQELNLDSILEQCNASFIIPIDYLNSLNTTGALPDEGDKTGMCFVRCFYEMSGFLQDWKLNTELIQTYLWPATGDTIPFCEKSGANEPNSCVRAYEIVKCLMTRAIVDAHYV